MKIKRITNQNRRDVHAEYECEGCGHVSNSWGYDDKYFHESVIPGLYCPECGESGEGLGVEYVPLKPKYPENHQI